MPRHPAFTMGKCGLGVKSRLGAAGGSWWAGAKRWAKARSGLRSRFDLVDQTTSGRDQQLVVRRAWPMLQP
jgi:hypothetical protein